MQRQHAGLRPAGRRALIPLGLALLLCLAGGAAPAADIPDRHITDAVEDELLFDVVTPEHRIDVTTAAGVVTLKGDVSNILAKDRAVRIAETVKGVRAVVDRMEVDPYMERSDDELVQDVKLALLQDPATEAYEFRVTADDGEVTLSGSVESWQERELAAYVAKGVKGVRALDNNVVMVPPEDRPDGEIREDVTAALRMDALVDDGLISVKVQDGVVSLAGTVGSAAEKRRAHLNAWVNGVKNVKTGDLEVAIWARNEDLRRGKYDVKSDAETARAVEDAMLYDPRVNSVDVATEVEDRIVTLRGTVNNLAAKRAARHDAQHVVGVLDVRNRIKVQADLQDADDEIANRIQAALERAVYLDRADIRVDVVNGTAYLYGDVDNAFHKSLADNIAARTKGVFRIRNYLDVRDEARLTADPYVDPYLLDTYAPGTWQPYRTASQDLATENRIENELWWSPFVDQDEVDVRVVNGVATLTGEVDSWRERSAATENAFEGGAIVVENELDIASGSE